MPKIQRRYYSLQIVDGYTHNVGIVSERTTDIPAEGISFIVAGPNNCSTPTNCPIPAECPQTLDNVFYSEGDYALLIVRMQVLREENSEEKIKPIQQKFDIQRLSTFCGILGPDPTPVPSPVFIPPEAMSSLAFFHFANKVMENLAIHPTEELLFDRFAKIGIIPGRSFPPPWLSLKTLGYIKDGIVQGNADIDDEVSNSPRVDRKNGWKVIIDPPQFGCREVMQGRYLTRAASARGVGIYGLDREEAFYPSSNETLAGLPLNASKNNPYFILFRPDTLPPIQSVQSSQNSLVTRSLTGFWSLTMYSRVDGSFVPNPINRFSLGSRELDILCRYGDGSFPIIMQTEEPVDEGFRRNWLPAPDGEFYLIARLYLPTEEAVNRPYLPPPVLLGVPLRGEPTNCPLSIQESLQ